ncbi:MAG: hypothetical protein SFY67_15060 [Candidatus Melainabacteria bacterium]|nr:hypothetical protein [Candidatus Melainabacteria bacterium]
MHLKTITKLSLAAISIVAMAPAVLADTITTVETTSVQQPVQITQPTKVVTTTVKQSVPRQSNYLKRLARIMEQIEQGESKGWLTSEQATDLRNQHKILIDKEATFYTNGNGLISKADGDCLEKEINGLNISVTRLMNSGMATNSNTQL